MDLFLKTESIPSVLLIALQRSAFSIGVLVLTSLLASAAVASEEPDAFPPVRIIDQAEYYAFAGSTIDQIDAQLIQHAERREGSGNGSTRSRFEITKTLLQRSDRCVMTTLEVSVTITTILPRWQPDSVVSDSLRLRWKQSSAILERHEDGHREHALEAARNLRRILARLKPKRDCLALAAAIALELQSSLQHLNQRQARYDDRTWNGLRDDPLSFHPAGVKTQLRSAQRPYRADRTLLDFYNR